MPRAAALAANEFQIGNVCRPLALTPPLKSMGIRHVPCGSSID